MRLVPTTWFASDHDALKPSSAASRRLLPYALICVAALGCDQTSVRDADGSYPDVYDDASPSGDGATAHDEVPTDEVADAGGFAQDAGGHDGHDGGAPSQDDGAAPSPDGGHVSDDLDAEVELVVDGGQEEGVERGPDPTPESILGEGPYSVASYDDGYRDGPDFAGGTIWHPIDAPVPFAYVAIAPGYVAFESSIASWGPFLASHGIVAITIATNSLWALPKGRADALLDALTSLDAEHDRADSPLHGKLDPSRRGLMGWSFGGGGALIAANRTPSLRAVVGFCPKAPDWRPEDNQVPAFVFAGSADGIAPPRQNDGAWLLYDSIPEATPKMYYEVEGANHWIANNPSNADGQIGRYGLSWLKVFLEGDERYRPFLLEQPDNASSFELSF